MADDDETLVIECPRCNKKFEKAIGWLKAHRSFRCDHCDTTLWHEQNNLADVVRKAQENVKNSGRRRGGQ